MVFILKLWYSPIRNFCANVHHQNIIQIFNSEKEGNNMNIGIYARKSVYRDNSDSVIVQIKSCKDYANLLFNDKQITFKIYDKDEGFSGKNTERPSFMELLNDIKNHKLDTVIVYKLDRISRSVKDFSEIYEIMHSHNVTFLSVKESFDTSTPIGRTVMYILAAFAQLERETTSERVTDSMDALGASGAWTGGKTPTGMTSIRKLIGDKEHSYLVVDSEKIKLVKLLGELLLDGYSITKLERHCRDNGIRSDKGKYLNSSQIHFILSNPVYCCNDLDAYYYFQEKGLKIPPKEQFDGTHGLIAYGRTEQKDVRKKRDSYSLAVGIHEPIFSGAEWISIQQRFKQNKMYRSAKYESGILKGILKCNCGSRMEVRTSIKNGITYSYYYCAKMHRMGKEYCDSGYTSIEYIDNAFIEKLKSIHLDPNSISPKEFQPSQVSSNKLLADLKTITDAIDNLTKVLMDNQNSSAVSYIITRIETLDNEKHLLESAIRKAEIAEKNIVAANETCEQIYHNICTLLTDFESMTYREKNELIRKIVKSCIFDGETLNIIF